MTLAAGGHAAEMAIVDAEALLPAPDSDQPNACPAGHRFVRRRPLAVHLSSSQTSADADPVASVSFGWAAKEEELRF